MVFHRRVLLLFTTLTIICQIVSGIENWDDLLNDDTYDTSNWVNPNDMGLEPRPLKVRVLKEPVVEDIKNPPSDLDDRTISDVTQQQQVTPHPSKSISSLHIMYILCFILIYLDSKSIV